MGIDFKFGRICFWIVLGLLPLTLSCAYLQKRELAQKREQWASQKIANYRYKIKLFAFNQDGGKQILIEVLNGKQVSLKCVECELKNPETFTGVDTIEKIFGMIEKDIESDKYSLSVKYDENLGYPTEFKGKLNDRNVTDSSWKYEISNFEVIK